MIRDTTSHPQTKHHRPMTSQRIRLRFGAALRRFQSIVHGHLHADSPHSSTGESEWNPKWKGRAPLLACESSIQLGKPSDESVDGVMVPNVELIVMLSDSNVVRVIDDIVVSRPSVDRFRRIRWEE